MNGCDCGRYDNGELMVCKKHQAKPIVKRNDRSRRTTYPVIIPPVIPPLKFKS